MAVSRNDVHEQPLYGIIYSFEATCWASGGTMGAPAVPLVQVSYDSGATYTDTTETCEFNGADVLVTLTAAEMSHTSIRVRVIETGDTSHYFADAWIVPVYPFHTTTSPAAMGVASATAQGLTAALTATPANLPFLGDRLLSEIPAGMFLGWVVWIVTGTGAGQGREVRGFDPDGGGAGYAQFALDKPWATGMTPDGTSTFALCYLGSEAAAGSSLLTDLWDKAGTLGGFVLGDANGRGAASVEEVTGDGQQDVADAMKLTPAAGDPAAGSVNADLDSIVAAATEARLAELDPANLPTDVANIHAKTTNLPAIPAAVGSAMTLANDAVSAAALKTDAVAEIVAALNNLSSTQAQAACAAALLAYDAATGSDVTHIAGMTTGPSAIPGLTEVTRCYNNSEPWATQFLDANGDAYAITGLTIYLAIDSDPGVAYTSATVQRDSVGGAGANGIIVDNAATGEITVTFTAAQIAAMTRDKTWWYCFSRKDASGNTLTLLRGRLLVEWSLTPAAG